MSGRIEGGAKGATISASRTSTYQTVVILRPDPTTHAKLPRIKPGRPSTHSIVAPTTLHPPQSPESHSQTTK